MERENYRLPKKQKLIGLGLLVVYLLLFFCAVEYVAPKHWYAPEPADVMADIHGDFSFSEIPGWEVTHYGVIWRQEFLVVVSFEGEIEDYARFRASVDFTLPEELEYKMEHWGGDEANEVHRVYKKEYSIPELKNGWLYVRVQGETCTLTISKKGIENLFVVRKLEKSP